MFVLCAKLCEIEPERCCSFARLFFSPSPPLLKSNLYLPHQYLSSQFLFRDKIDNHFWRRRNFFVHRYHVLAVDSHEGFGI